MGSPQFVCSLLAWCLICVCMLPTLPALSLNEEPLIFISQYEFDSSGEISPEDIFVQHEVHSLQADIYESNSFLVSVGPTIYRLKLSNSSYTISILLTIRNVTNIADLAQMSHGSKGGHKLIVATTCCLREYRCYGSKNCSAGHIVGQCSCGPEQYGSFDVAQPSGIQFLAIMQPELLFVCPYYYEMVNKADYGKQIYERFLQTSTRGFVPRRLNVALISSGQILYYRFAETRYVFSPAAASRATKNGVDHIFINGQGQTLIHNYGSFNYTSEIITPSLISPRLIDIDLGDRMTCLERDREYLLVTTDGIYSFNCHNYSIELLSIPGDCQPLVLDEIYAVSPQTPHHNVNDEVYVTCQWHSPHSQLDYILFRCMKDGNWSSNGDLNELQCKRDGCVISDWMKQYQVKPLHDLYITGSNVSLSCLPTATVSVHSICLPYGVWSNTSLVNTTLRPCWSSVSGKAAKAVEVDNSKSVSVILPVVLAAIFLVSTLIVTVLCVVKRCQKSCHLSSVLHKPSDEESDDRGQNGYQHEYSDPDSIYEEIADSESTGMRSADEASSQYKIPTDDDYSGYVVNVETVPEYIELLTPVV